MCFMHVLPVNKSGRMGVLKWENDSTLMITLKGKSSAVVLQKRNEVVPSSDNKIDPSFSNLLDNSSREIRLLHDGRNYVLYEYALRRFVSFNNRSHYSFLYLHIDANSLLKIQEAVKQISIILRLRMQQRFPVHSSVHKVGRTNFIFVTFSNL